MTIDFCLNIDTKSPYLFCKKYKWTSWKNLVFAVVKNALREVYIELLTVHHINQFVSKPLGLSSLFRSTRTKATTRNLGLRYQKNQKALFDEGNANFLR